MPQIDKWYYGDTHFHSQYTDNYVESGGPIEATKIMGRAIGIDWVTVTDHSFDLDDPPQDWAQFEGAIDKWDSLNNEASAYSDATFRILVGEEVSVYNSYRSLIFPNGKFIHLLAYDINDFIEGEGADSTWPIPGESGQTSPSDSIVTNISNQGGFCYAAHPVAQPPHDFGEGVNAYYLSRGDWLDDDYNVAELTGLQIWNTKTGDWEINLIEGLRIWIDLLSKGKRIFIAGGSDAHGDYNKGRTVTFTSFFNLNPPEENENAFAKVRTYVYTEAFNEDGILDALRNGHSIMTDGPLVIFNITNEHGETAIIGNETAGNELTLNIQWESTSEFGTVDHIYVHRGIVGETDEGDEIYDLTPNTLSGTVTLDLTSKIPQPQLKTVYIRLSATTNKSNRAYTNPIWINSPIDRGLQYLRTTQQGTEEPSDGDGAWSSNVGITALAVLAFLNAGYDETDPDVQDAIGYILQSVQPDGSICRSSGSKTYETSLSIFPLVATHNDSYNTIIENAAQWLKDSQWDENCLWGSVSTNHYFYGGFGYGYKVRPDLSNSQFALMALDAAGVPKDDPLWTKAQVFLNRCQARDASNDQSWADGRNSGGFINTRNGYVPWSGSIDVYWSITGAGIWGLRLCNVDTDDDRLQDAMKWVSNNYYWDRNPGMSNPGDSQFYYYLSMSKALTMMDTDVINGNNWYTDLSQNITSLQSPQGYWINGRSSNGWENNKDLVTSYAILSLQTRGEIPEDIKRLSYLTFILRSNADLHIYDPLGRHVGKNYDTGEIEIEIPNATYSADPQNITIPELIPGNYRIVLIGTGTGEYTLNVTGGVGNDTVSEDSYTANITEGEVHDAIVNVAMITWLTIHVDEPEPIDPIVLSATGTGNVSFITDAGTIEDLIALNESDMPEENQNADFSHGIFRFNITGVNPGQIANITIAFPQDIPITAQYWICGPNGSIDNPQPMRWYPIPMGSNDGDNVITITKQDGGIGDEDGIANGIIVDDGGPGNPFGVRAPTLTPIGLIALVGLLTAIAVSRVEKKR